MFSSTKAFSFFLALAVAPTAFADIYITNPVDSTTCTAGQTCTVQWQDDGVVPNLPTIGLCDVGLFAGGQQQQTQLQVLAQGLDVSKVNTIQWTPDGTIGPNSSNAYFIRFTALNLKDTTNPQFPHQSFSHKFTLAGMTGQFSPQVQAQVDGANAPPTGSTPVPAQTTARPTVSTPVSSSKPSTPSPSSSSKPDAALTLSPSSAAFTAFALVAVLSVVSTAV